MAQLIKLSRRSHMTVKLAALKQMQSSESSQPSALVKRQMGRM